MPSQKRKPTDDPAESSDDASHAVPAKRSKKTAHSSSAPARDEDGNVYWEISRARRVTISEFNKKKMVSVREYYEKDGRWLPGKKGISMTLEQYAAFVAVLPEIESELVRSGEEVPRPQYGDGALDAKGDDADGDGDSDGGGAERGDTRRNFEATSDEDE